MTMYAIYNPNADSWFNPYRSDGEWFEFEGCHSVGEDELFNYFTFFYALYSNRDMFVNIQAVAIEPVYGDMPDFMDIKEPRDILGDERLKEIRELAMQRELEAVTHRKLKELNSIHY